MLIAESAGSAGLDCFRVYVADQGFLALWTVPGHKASHMSGRDACKTSVAASSLPVVWYTP